MDYTDTRTIGAGQTIEFAGAREFAILAATAAVDLVGYGIHGEILFKFDGAGAGFHYRPKERAWRIDATSATAGNVVNLAIIDTGRLVAAKG